LIFDLPSDPIISVSGIRGILGSSLTPEHILKFSSAFAAYSRYGKIVVGRDGRIYGDLIADMVVSHLSLYGCRVIDLDIVPTPTVSLAVRYFKAAGGISITASHNPQEWNGMKFIGSDGIVLDASKVPSSGGLSSGRRASFIKQIQYHADFSRFHISKILNCRFVNVPLVRKRKFRVVIDCVNSAGSFIIPELLKQLGCKVITHDCHASGIFTRNPEPLPANIKKTCALVKKHKADIGIVVDPDADRLVIITEKGTPFGEENTIVTAIRHVFQHVPKSKRLAVVNLSTTRAADDIARELGGKLYRSPVGELNVIRKMKSVSSSLRGGDKGGWAVIGGEGSGGVILPEVNFCRDSLVGIGLILSEIAESKLSVSEYQKSLPQYFIRKETIHLSKRNAPLSLGEGMGERLFRQLEHRGRLDTQDGLRIDFPDSWINLRKSNTEPILRIIAEARTSELASDLIDRFKKILSG